MTNSDVRTRWAVRLAVVVLLSAVVAPLFFSVASATTTTTTGSSTSAQLAPMSGSYVFTVAFQGHQRSYRLHVPPAASASTPLPLVLNLHGATQNGLLQEGYSDMDASADQNGYLVAYPDGTDDVANSPPPDHPWDASYSWDAGQCCGAPSTSHTNDVAFLLKVISDAAQRTPVNLRRVYVTGMSAGGMMAYAMANQASTHIAAIASVEGQVETPTIHPTRAVPTLEFHSMTDPIAKWDAKGSLSVMHGVDAWVRADGCATAPHDGTPIVGAKGTAASGLSATLVTYTGCRSGAEVALWRLNGSGHVWPGSALNTGPRSSWVLDGVGRGTTLIDADQEMWKFFQHFELPAQHS